MPKYKSEWLRYDFIAGLTLWGVLIPEVIAYAVLAGLPPQAGLYTILGSLLLYAIFGTSRQLIVTATSASAVLLAATIMDLNPANTQAYISIAAGVVLLVGIIFIIFAAFRIGFITQFISRPVMKGFVSGLAIFIIINQLPKFFGLTRVGGDTLNELWHTITNIGQANWVTFLVGVLSLLLLFSLEKIYKKFPAGLLVLILGIALSYLFGLANYGVKIVGNIPSGLPSFSLPDIGALNLWILVPGAIGLVLVIFSESLGEADAFADKHDYEIKPNQELLALGVANLGSGLIGGLAAGGSMSQSAVNDRAGAKTQVSSLVAAVLGFVTILALTPLFKNLPEAVLAAIIVFAVLHLVKIQELRNYYRVEKVEFILGMTALLGVIILGVLQGLIIAIVFSLVWFIYESSQAKGSILGQIPDSPGDYSDIERHKENKTIPGVIIYRLNTPVYFANAAKFREGIKKLLYESDPPAKALIINISVNDNLDITSAEQLKRLITDLDKKNISIMFVDVHEPVIKIAREFIGESYFRKTHIFPSVDKAVKYFLKK